MQFMTPSPPRQTVAPSIASASGMSQVWRFSLLLTLSAAAALLIPAAQAQCNDQSATAPQSAVQAVPVSGSANYSAKDIERAFNFMDSNNDGQISREEAAGFRGVARHFDEADSNQDNALSRAEFSHALSGEKPR